MPLGSCLTCQTARTCGRLVYRKKPNEDKKPQCQRFFDAARESGTDESAEAFELVFREIVPAKARQQECLKSLKSSRLGKAAFQQFDTVLKGSI